MNNSTLQSNSITTNKKGTMTKIFEYVTKYDAVIIFGGGSLLVLVVIFLTSIFAVGPPVRDNLVFNIVSAGILAATFIYIVYEFMGASITVFGKSISLGFLIYLAVIIFILFILGG